MLAHLLLGVEAAVRLAIADVRVEVLSEDGLLPPGADLGEARVLLDLEPPPLVVGQVQVEGVELVEREEVDDLLDELGWIDTSVPRRGGRRDSGSGARRRSPQRGYVPARGERPARAPAGGAAGWSRARARGRSDAAPRESLRGGVTRQMVALRIRAASALGRSSIVIELDAPSWAGARDTGRGSVPPDAALSGAASRSASERRSAFAVSERKIRVALSSRNSPGLAMIETGDGTMGYRSGAGFACAGTCVPAAYRRAQHDQAHPNDRSRLEG